ncbi:MAG: TfoX/Sxy family DNA transformation protein [Bacteroidales bacterium]|nr:TfoX/Sxy family DNA transformation protein [Bacteroidales bacterium]
MKKLSHLPNINPQLEAKLLAAGIDSPETLRERGSRNAFMRIKMMDSGACYNMLLSLEGAIQGRLMEELDEQTRLDLKIFMEIFNR